MNGDEDLYVRWPLYYNRMDVLQPFLLTQTAGVYDLFIHARGGGSSGQAGAARLAVGRALVNACAACADLLTEGKKERAGGEDGEQKREDERAEGGSG